MRTFPACNTYCGCVNMKKEKEKKSSLKSNGIIIMLFIGVLLGIVMATVMNKYDVDIAPKHAFPFAAVFLLALYIGFFINIIIHEAGHLLFGLVSGYKFSSFRITSFMIVNDKGKIRFKRQNIAGTGGQCLMVPPDMEDGKLPVILYNLGGCIMNIIFAVVFLLLHFLCKTDSFLPVFLLALSVVGFLFAITNGIPIHTANIDNDGYNAFALRKNPEAMFGFWVQLKAIELTSKGVRLKDMPDEWFDIPSDEAMKNSMVAARCVFACNRLTDAGKFKEADALMSHILDIESGIAGIHSNLLMCDRIFIELITENRRDVIDSMFSVELKKFMKAMNKYPSVIRTEYALALLFENDGVKAEKVLNRFKKIEKTHPYPCEIQGEKELIEIVNHLIMG